MSVERVSSIYDIPALQAEQEKYISFLQQSKQAIIDLNNLRVTSKVSDLSGFTKATQELNQAINNSTNSTQNAVKAKKQLTQAEIEVSLATQKRTASIKNDIIETKSATGSYDQLQATLKRLTAGYKAMSQSQRESAAGREVQKNILDTKNVLKSLDASVGDHQRNVGNYVKSIGDGFGRIATRVVEYAAAYAGFNAIKSFFSDTISEALEAEKASLRFKSTLDNLGRVDAFDRLTQKAKDFAKQFTYLDNDEIVGVFEKLVTYGKLSENQINKLTPVIINFAAKSGISIQESASVILKALEGNGKALKEYGINITDAKTESARFGVVMNELGKKVEGAAEAFGETTTGKIASTEQHFKDLKEEIGTGLLPILNKLLEGVNGLLTGFKHMAEDGVSKALGRAFTGFKTYMLEGAGALKAYQEQMQAFDNANPETERKRTFDLLKLGGLDIKPEDTPVIKDADKAFGGGSEDAEKKKAARKDNLQSLKESVDHEFDIYKRHQEDVLKIFDEEIKDDKKSYTEKLLALESYNKAANDLLLAEEENRIEVREREAKNEVAKLKEQLTGASANERKRINDNIKITEENLQKDILNIIDEYALKRLDLVRTSGQSRQDIIDEQHKAEEKSVEESNKRMEDLSKKHLDKVQADLEETARKKKEALDKEKEEEKEKLDTIQEFGQAGLDLGQTFADADITRQKNKLQEESDLITAKEKQEIDAVNASTRTEQEKAAAIAIIQARAVAEQQAIQIKERALDYKHAQFEKGIAILEMIAQIGISIAKGKFQAAALAGIALIKLIATPIPKLKHGRGTGKEELAIVGDGGVPEYIHRADGTLEKTPSVETLTHLMPKDKVYPNKQAMMKELAMSSMLSNYVVNKQGGIDKADIDNLAGRIENAVGEIKIHTTNITKEGWREQNQRLSDYDKWVQNNIKN